MRKKITPISLLIFTILAAISCGSDSNEEIPAISEGTWNVIHRSFKTNHEEFDKKMNPYLMAELDTTRIEQFFDESTKESEIITKRESGTEFLKTYIWEIKQFPGSSANTHADSLYLLSPFEEGLIKMQGKLQLAKNSLTVSYKLDNTNVKDILIDIYIDPNIADSYDDIKGTYTVRMQL